ncbi:polar growth protein [Apophysomyces sp. BC1034]|nr:polar growth protein [Apophysomyces sp. BC1021]KAG0192805.1 polar growth protein [Apophysomyces sp. BC1034]
MNLEIVYAIHNFEAENEDEIAFGIGEPIVVLERDEKYQDGWWQGRNANGDVGLFPMNYTSPAKPNLGYAHSFSPHSSYSSPLSTASNPSTKAFDRSSFTLEDQIDNAISKAQLISTHENSNHLPTPPSSQRGIEQKIENQRRAPQISLSVSEAGDGQPEDWSTDRVATWLQSVGLGMVADNFIEQEITGDILLDLTIDSLKELGISTYGKRYKVMNAINKLKATAAYGGSVDLNTSNIDVGLSKNKK